MYIVSSLPSKIDYISTDTIKLDLGLSSFLLPSSMAYGYFCGVYVRLLFSCVTSVTNFRKFSHKFSCKYHRKDP